MRCERCGGRGTVLIPEAEASEVPGGAPAIIGYARERCPMCHGAGTVAVPLCSRCNLAVPRLDGTCYVCDGPKEGGM